MNTDRSENLITLALESKGVERRDFLQFCGTMAALLGLPSAFTSRIAKAIESGVEKRPSVVWLNFQSCTGCTESFTRSDRPSVAQAVLNSISLDYNETLMAAAGRHACEACTTAMTENRGKYILVVEGSIPSGADGTFCTIAGRTGLDVFREAAEGAAFIVALGTCASYGGLPAAVPNPSGALGVEQLAPEKQIVNIPGCPPIGDVFMGTLVHFLLFHKLPNLDKDKRPLFAYGKLIHEQCRRHSHYEAAEMCTEFGSEAYRSAYCLFPLGCKGAYTRNACTVIRWNMSSSWCGGSGHPCVGCSERGFWDTMSPFYSLRERS